MTKFRTLDDLGDVTGKVALVRVDLNLPMQDGAVTDDRYTQQLGIGPMPAPCRGQNTFPG